MKSEIEVFREFTRKKGLRNTPERETIIKEIFATHDHFDVDELYLRLKNKKEKISKPSIYRLIPHLLESGLIQEAYFEDGHFHYEHIYGHEHHCHLRCLTCGKTIEFQEKAIEKLERKLAEEYDFSVTGHKLEVFGFCPRCKVDPDVAKVEDAGDPRPQEVRPPDASDRRAFGSAGNPGSSPSKLL